MRSYRKAISYRFNGIVICPSKHYCFGIFLWRNRPRKLNYIILPPCVFFPKIGILFNAINKRLNIKIDFKKLDKRPINKTHRRGHIVLYFAKILNGLSHAHDVIFLPDILIETRLPVSALTEILSPVFNI